MATQKLIDAQKLLEQRRILTPDGDSYAFNMDAVYALTPQELEEVQKSLADAGLYVPSFIDGVMGPMTEHAMRTARDPEYARDYIAQTALTDDHLTSREIVFLQTSLNAMGYGGDEPIDVDGKFGKQTTSALKEFLQENPDHIDSVAPSLKARMLRFMTPEDTQVFTANIALPRPRPNIEAVADAVVTPEVEEVVEAAVEDVPLPRPRPDHLVAETTPTPQRTFEVVDGVLMENGEVVPLPWPQDLPTKHPPVPMPADMRPPEPQYNSIYAGLGLIHPDAITAIREVPRLEAVAQQIFDEAQKQGVPEYQALNMVWKESRLGLEVGEHRFALRGGFGSETSVVAGIMQLHEDTAEKQGISKADRMNDDIAISAGIREMADMQERFGTDLMPFGYNAGPGWVPENGDIYAIMRRWEEQNEARGTADRSLLRVQTHEYYQDTDDRFFTDELLERAIRANAEFVMDRNPEATVASSPVLTAYLELAGQPGHEDPRSALEAIEAAIATNGAPIINSEIVISDHLAGLAIGEKQLALAPTPSSLPDVVRSDVALIVGDEERPEMVAALEQDLLLSTFRTGLAGMDNNNDSAFNGVFRAAYDNPVMMSFAPAVARISLIPQTPETDTRGFSRATFELSLPN